MDILFTGVFYGLFNFLFVFAVLKLLLQAVYLHAKLAKEEV